MLGGDFFINKHIQAGKQSNLEETQKTPLRSEVINYAISFLNRPVTYLEIGVRNPADNFDKITASEKHSVDPGVEFEENPVEFKMTSDEFFSQLKDGKVLSSSTKFDVIFVDGLHEATQVEKDIQNALEYITEDGFVILHDCNPPTEWHARECYEFRLTPAEQYWNGTTWKAFVKARENNELFGCCIDTDWGVGILSKKIDFGGKSPIKNEFFEFSEFARNRQTNLNLMSFDSFKKILDAR